MADPPPRLVARGESSREERLEGCRVGANLCRLSGAQLGISVGERPMRYGELGSAITEWTGSRIGDGEITRTVHRLVDSGLAEESFADGHRLFTLTPAGHIRLETIRALGRALRGDEPEADGDGSEDGSEDR